LARSPGAAEAAATGERGLEQAVLLNKAMTRNDRKGPFITIAPRTKEGWV
jgi:hypothetical protein